MIPVDNLLYEGRLPDSKSLLRTLFVSRSSKFGRVPKLSRLINPTIACFDRTFELKPFEFLTF